MRAEQAKFTPSAPLKLGDFLHPDRVVFLSANNKNAAMKELADALAAAGAGDAAILTQAITRRENLMSTGVGRGLGFPHACINTVPQLMITIGIKPSGVYDYSSTDGCPVQIIVLIAADDCHQNLYLRVISQLAKSLADESIRQQILSSATSEQAFAIISAAWEHAI